MTGRTMLQPEPAPSLTLSPAPSPLLQRKATNPSAIPSVTRIVRDGLRSPGKPLAPATRAFMEGRFGHDFGEVRVHTGEKAAESAAAVNAHAYTVGRDVVFGAERYAPGTTEGKRLLAHELAHVVQQRGQDAQLRGVNRLDDPAELEAETAASRIVDGSPAPNITSLGGGGVLQRQEARDEEPKVGEQAEAPITRAEEIERSVNSPGEIAVSVQPPVVSLYNFAIDSASLKDLHRGALRELRDLIERSKPRGLRLLVRGHADSTGGSKTNDPLSWERARAVEKDLSSPAGAEIELEGFGEEDPIADNETVAGRNRNRRVDIWLLPAKPQPPPTPGTTEDTPPPVPPPIVDPPRRDEPPEPPIVDPPGKLPPGSSTPTPDQPPQATGDKDFCQDYPILCAAGLGGGVLAGGALVGLEALGGLGLAALLYCVKNPQACIPGPGQQPQQQPGPPKRACVNSFHVAWYDRWGSRKLISNGQTIDAHEFGDSVQVMFGASIEFVQDASGCECNCGEYRQEVKGWFKENGVSQPHRMGKALLDPSAFHEDKDSQGIPYGHRLNPPTNRWTDSFAPVRLTGCEYNSVDTPGAKIRNRMDIMSFELTFLAGPVDVCPRTPGTLPKLVPGWPPLEWTVRGDYIPPPPKPRPIKPPSRGVTPPLPMPGTEEPQFTPVPTPYDSCKTNGVDIGCDTKDFLERWESPDRDIYLPKVLEAIEIETNRLVMVYARDVGGSAEDILMSPEFGELQQRARRTACASVLTAVDMTDLISEYCE